MVNFLQAHAVVLVVVVPLLAAPLCVLFSHRWVARTIALAASSSVCALSLLILHTVRTGPAIRYAVGGWAPPLGIELRVTPLSAFVLVTISFVAAVVLAFEARGVAASSVSEKRLNLFYAAYLLAVTGLVGMVISNDLFNVFVFLEISSLASYTLIGLGKDRRALVAAYSYLLIGTVGATFYLLGVGLLYQMTGTLNMLDLAARLPAVADTRTVSVGFAFLMVGLFIKLAVFPLHQWLPNAYSHAPAKAGAMLAGTATKVSYYILLRVIFTVFGAAFVFGRLGFDRVLLPLSLLAMFVGSAAAIYQTDVRRLLAYSSIAQVGYMTLGLSMQNAEALTGGIVHLFNHGVTKSGLFLVFAALASRTGSWNISAMAGTARTAPLAFGGFVIGGFGLIGIPGTAGFVSKWYLVQGALEYGKPWVAFLILLSSMLAVVYVWKIVEVGFFGQPARGSEERSAQKIPLSMLVPAAVLLGSSVVFGLWTEPTLGAAAQAAAFLLDFGTGGS